MILPRPFLCSLAALSIMFILCIPRQGNAQCNNSIALKRAVIQSVSENKGVIEIKVNTSDNFTCTLNTESGSGVKKVTTKKGQGSTVVTFQVSNINSIYQIEFEFLSEKGLCRKLQKSGIILEKE
jgi:hypothetical protein